MIIRLKVFEQTLSIVDTKSIPRKGSKDYLVLQFMFSSDWKDLNKVCYLQKGEVSQPIDVVDGLVEVPEWFTQQDSFDVTLFGKSGNQEVPTNVVSLRLGKSNTLWEQDAPEPQPSWIVKLIDLNNHPPVPGNNGYWMLWDTDKGTYVEGDLPLPDMSGIPDGGTVGQLLSKTESGTEWIDPPQSGVQPDWNQNDSTAADYIKNRPFYTGDPVETVLVEESTVQFTDIGGLYVGAIKSTFSPTVGNAYKISWDDTDYESTCVKVGQRTCIGNLSIDGSGPDTGEPFLMQVINQEVDVATLDGASYHTISISRFVPGVVVKIDPKYLPDNPLNITGATVGQIAKITAVDDSGKPTAWEAEDLPNNEKFIVTFSGNDSSYVCDKTMVEIINAYENGQDISARFTGISPDTHTHYTNLLLSLTTYAPYELIEFQSDIEINKLRIISAYIDGSGCCGVSEYTALDNSLTENHMAANAKAVGDALARKQDTLIQNGATVGQIAKITAVDDSGKPTAWEAVDDRLPNVNTNDDGKALIVRQISEFDAVYVLEDIDSISLGIRAASPGQIVKITAVDDSGKPTAWEAVDMPSGGGETWELINEITIPDDAEETNALVINEDLNGNPFELKKALLLVYMPKYTGGSTIPNYAFSSLNGIHAGGSSPAAYTNFVSPNSAQNRSMWWRVSVANNGVPYHEELARNNVGGSKRAIGGSGSMALFDEYIIDGTEPAKESITEIGTKGNLIYAGCYFALYGVRK